MSEAERTSRRNSLNERNVSCLKRDGMREREKIYRHVSLFKTRERERQRDRESERERENLNKRNVSFLKRDGMREREKL